MRLCADRTLLIFRRRPRLRTVLPRHRVPYDVHLPRWALPIAPSYHQSGQKKWPLDKPLTHGAAFQRNSVSAWLNTVLIAIGAKSGGYPYFLRMRLTRMRNLARALSLRCQSTVTFFCNCSTSTCASFRSSSLPRTSTALGFCASAS